MAMKSNNNGCLGYIIVLFIISIIISIVNNCDSRRRSPTDATLTDKQNTSKSSSAYNQHIKDDINNLDYLSAEEIQYIDNSLRTGSTPYSDVYGKNYKCRTSQCSGISVTAPHSSDIVVIIKRNNSKGSVISHAYICGGDTYTFDLPDGIYQPFFYYGTGWNPEKEVGDGIKGGFVKDELYSKDEPQEVYQCVISYVLQLQHNGNFQTERSSQTEIF